MFSKNKNFNANLKNDQTKLFKLISIKNESNIVRLILCTPYHLYKIITIIILSKEDDRGEIC